MNLLTTINIAFLRKLTPRWLIFLLDILIVIFSVYASYLIRFNFKIPSPENHLLINYTLPTILFVRAITFFIFKSYNGIIRFTSIEDIIRILKILFIGSFIFVLINLISYTISKVFVIPVSILILEGLLTSFLSISFRLFVKSLFREFFLRNKIYSNVLIIGTGNFALSLKRSLDNDLSVLFNVKGFIDSKGNKKGFRLEGVKIYEIKDIEDLVYKEKIDTIIFAEEHLAKDKKQKIVDIALDLNLRMYELPTIKEWLGSSLEFKHLKEFKIENLLEREIINLDLEKIKYHITNKVILVTGAAGSIGSEIIKQIIKFNPKLLVLFDQAETNLYELNLFLKEKLNFFNFEYILGDLNDKIRLEYIFKNYKPQVVYHAAAYKHVPVLENNEYEAIKVNVLGTKLLADLSVKYNVEKFIVISTDKAVNSVGIMGATKRIAEMYCQALGNISNTKFITTRFGNVLASNGSVFSRFQKQIEQGGPITVTHPEVTRYFMTISEACLLVLEASAMGEKNEIFIFDMGQPIKILDLAKKMIRLSGLRENIDIKIIFTGLRKGEKLHEELFSTNETLLQTYHPQILIAKAPPTDYNFINSKILELYHTALSFDSIKIRQKLKEIVRDFHFANE